MIAKGNVSDTHCYVSKAAEAMKNTLKIARYATKKPGIIAFEHAFHGRTLMGMDTITDGNFCDLSIEAARQETIDVDLDYGDAEGIAGLLKHISRKEGIGALLAEGMCYAANEWAWWISPHMLKACSQPSNRC